MTALHIYMDEAGTMPVKQEDGPFAVASVAFLGDKDAIVLPEGRTKKLDPFCDFLLAAGALPVTTVVHPRAGYARAMANTLAAVRIIAQAHEICEEEHPVFRSADEVNIRNYVWAHAAEACLARTLDMHVEWGGQRIDSLYMRLDEKTLTPGLRGAVEHFAYRVPDLLRQFMSRSKHVSRLAKQDRLRCHYLASVASVARQDIHLQWSNDAHADGLRTRSFLADSFAWHVLHQMKEQGHTGRLQEALEQRRVAHRIIDVTRSVTQPVDTTQVRAWCERAGLEVPPEFHKAGV